MAVGLVFGILQGIGVALVAMALRLTADQWQWWEFAIGANFIVAILRHK